MRRFWSIGLLILLIAGCQSVARKPGSVRPVEPVRPVPSRPAPPKLEDLHPAERMRPTQAEQTAVEALMARMSREQRIAQHFMGHIPRSGLSEAMLADISKGLYGGFILYPWNYADESEVRRLTQALQTAALRGSPAIKLLLSADQEGGRVTAFRFPHLVRFPAAFYVGEYHDLGMAWANGYINGVELRGLGLNMNLAPVLGLYPKPDATIIGDRAMGADPETVSALGQSYIWGAQEGGVIPVAKHFPGHGAARLDSHYDLPVVKYTRSELMKSDLRPFVAAVEAGVEVIMTAHILYPKIDPTHPVTLSRIFLHDILRGELGFQGVIITDGLSMGALRKHFPLPETLQQAFEAGADIMLDHASYDVPSMVHQVLGLVDEGRLPMSTVDEGTRRILLLKLRHGLLSPAGT